MPKPTLEKRIIELEQRFVEMQRVIDQFQSGVATPPPTNSVGRVGVPITDEIAEVNDIDNFLFVTGPALLQRIAEGNQEAILEIIGWATNDLTIKDFLILWFAANENMRKHILFNLIIQNTFITEQRFSLLRGTISEESFTEIRETYMKLVEQAKATAAEPAPEVEAPAEVEPE